MREEDLWDMSDDELEAAFKEAQASEQSPDTDLEEEVDTSSPEEFEDSDTSEGDSEEEVEIDDGPEQSEDDADEADLEDSGHDTGDESDEEEVTDEDESEAAEDDPDGEPEEEEDPSSEETEAEEEEEQPAQTYKFRANGKEYEFSTEELVEQFPKIFGQAMDYTKKMQTIKPWRKTIDAIEGAELTHEDVSLMIDVLKGDKNAITEVLKRTGVDTLELDTEAESAYEAKDYGRDDNALAIKDIIDDISRDQEYATTQSILAKEWDDKSWNTMSQNPEMIRKLHIDVKSGMYDTLQPIAEKLKVYDGGSKSDLDYYKLAAQEHFTQAAKQEALEKQRSEQAEQAKAQAAAAEAEKKRLAALKADEQKRSATKAASAKRKAAAPTKNVSSGRDVIDYLDDSDEAFDDWYKRLQESI